MPDTQRGNTNLVPIKMAEGDRTSGETHRPNLTVYKNSPSAVQELSDDWRTPDIDAWPVERPSAEDARLAVLTKPDSPQAKAYRVLRHRLLATANSRVIAVTSARPGEGKTTCALNLALALAEESTARVLFVECNTQRPAIGELFDFMPPICFMQQLAQAPSGSSRWTVVEITGTRLHLAAVSPDIGGMPIDRVLFGAAIRQLARVYDYVVIDTSSVLEGADVNAIADASDGVLFTARAKKSSRKALKRAIEQLEPAPILGVALLDANSEVRV